MALRLRFSPSIELRRLQARPHIDENGVVYANAYDQIGIAGTGQDEEQSVNAFPTHTSLGIIDTQRRERDRAPSPEEIPKAPTQKPGEAETKWCNSGEGCKTIKRTPTMPAFQAINAVPTAAGADGTNAAPPVAAPPVLPPAAVPSGPAISEIRELPARDWTLADTLRREERFGVIYYLTRWKCTRHDVSFIRQREDSVWVVRYRGVDWLVDVIGEPVYNEQLGAFERKVKWEDTWHPLWEFVSARQSVVCWERRDKPDLAPPAKDWWLYPHSIAKYHDPVVNFEPGRRREIIDDEIEPELHADYTLSLLERALQHLAAGERGVTPAATICRMLNLPVRQLLTFSKSFIDAGEYFSLHREEFERAAFVHIVGFACRDPCSSCREKRSPLPFDICVVLAGDFNGYDRLGSYTARLASFADIGLRAVGAARTVLLHADEPIVIFT